jgi:hypothetical protein
MEKTMFNQIITNYTKIAAECEEFVKIGGDFDLESLTIKEFKELIAKARSLQSKSDSILHNELYHLIGMGNLTATQTQKLCTVIKKIASARSYFKPISTYVLNKLPEVPDKSSYKCDIAGIKLNSLFTK